MNFHKLKSQKLDEATHVRGDTRDNNRWKCTTPYPWVTHEGKAVASGLSMSNVSTNCGKNVQGCQAT
jgi:hypothetical protein